MVRSSKVEECMICGEIPCICFAKPKKAPAPRKPKAEKPEVAKAQAPSSEPVKQHDELVLEPAKKKSAFAAMKAAAKPAQPVAPAIEVVTTQQQDVPLASVFDDIEDPDEEAQWRQAIRALAPILSDDDKRTYAHILESPETMEERRRAWRFRTTRTVEDSDVT